ncbi:MAG: class I SAM-dependent methyltransferase, partial [Thermoanaerobaculia bacterium]
MQSTPFAGKADLYDRYRAAYPSEAIDTLVARAGLTGHQVVADLGSGTGLLTRPLLPYVSIVYAVEPAEDMRRVAGTALPHEPKFRSVAGSAESTGLPARSVDAITCGNSFHYFDSELARKEAQRILRAGGRAAILFHDSPPVPDSFTKDYLAFLDRVTPPRLASSHSSIGHERRLSAFFGGIATTADSGEQLEHLSWETIRGRFQSTS